MTQVVGGRKKRSKKKSRNIDNPRKMPLLITACVKTNGLWRSMEEEECRPSVNTLCQDGWILRPAMWDSGRPRSPFSVFFFLSRRDAPGKTQTFTSIRLLLQTLSKWLLHIWIRRSILILIYVYQPAHSGNLSKKKCLLPVMIEPVSSFGVENHRLIQCALPFGHGEQCSKQGCISPVLR